ncbi:MAG TPA: hypothetical protein PKZ53_06685 [Acidobacteriota bacterium]|nr:hypothetical protein [Acidobacteriota bacterium]
MNYNEAMAELDVIHLQMSMIWAQLGGDPWQSDEFRELQSRSSVLSRQLPKLRAADMLEKIGTIEQDLAVNPSAYSELILMKLRLDYQLLCRNIEIQERLEDLEKQQNQELKQLPPPPPSASSLARRKPRAHRSIWKGKQ